MLTRSIAFESLLEMSEKLNKIAFRSPVKDELFKRIDELRALPENANLYNAELHSAKLVGQLAPTEDFQSFWPIKLVPEILPLPHNEAATAEVVKSYEAYLSSLKPSDEKDV